MKMSIKMLLYGVISLLAAFAVLALSYWIGGDDMGAVIVMGVFIIACVIFCTFVIVNKLNTLNGTDYTDSVKDADEEYFDENVAKEQLKSLHNDDESDGSDD